MSNSAINQRMTGNDFTHRERHKPVDQKTPEPQTQVWQLQIYCQRSIKTIDEQFPQRLPTKFFDNRAFLKQWADKDVYINEAMLVPFVCQYVFLSDAEAQLFLPDYLSQLVEAGMLDSDKLYSDLGKNQINKDYIKVVVQPLSILMPAVPDRPTAELFEDL